MIKAKVAASKTPYTKLSILLLDEVVGLAKVLIREAATILFSERSQRRI